MMCVCAFAKQSKQLKSINLSDNALGPKGVEACKEMLTGQNDLERLFLCRNGVSAEAMHTLADLLLFRGPEECVDVVIVVHVCVCVCLCVCVCVSNGKGTRWQTRV